MKNKIILLALMLLSITSFAQTNWYVDYQNGNNSNNGTAPGTAVKTVDYLLANSMIQPKDTVLIMGQYNNPSYDPTFNYGGDADRANPHIWHKENTIKINNLNGQFNQYITFKPYDNSTVLKGDGANIIRITNCSYIIIDGFEIEGEVDNITIDEAEGVYTDGMQFLYLAPGTVDPTNPPLDSVLFRVNSGTTEAAIDAMTFPIIGQVNRPSYTDTRGLYVSNSNHIELKNNKIHHMPGGGLRVSSSSYVNINNNEIYRCSARSFSGTHALVVTKTKVGTANSTDDTLYSVKIYQNYLHDNYNEVFSWVGTKSFIVARIDEGKGISLQRNNLSAWNNGNKRILVENNLCVWNGFSGVHSNDGQHIDFRHNTCYMNSYTNSVTYANSTQQGNNIGISAQGGDDIRIENNISVVDVDWGGFAISSGGTTNLVVKNNLIFGNNGTLTEDVDVTAVDSNTVIQDPLFVDASAQNFNLLFNSPAKNSSSLNFSPTIDYLGNNRDANPDRGAFEFIPVATITVQGQGGVSTITTAGGTLQMEATVLPANATDNSVTWSVTNGTGSATIDANGVLTATGNGTVTVTATANDGSGVSGSTVITISNQNPTVLVTSITVQGQGGVSTITTAGGTLQMEATVLPANATDNSVTWSVTNGTGSATISTTGLLTATGNGTVTVTATANDGSGVSGSTVITISNQNPTVLVTSITVQGQGGVSTITTAGGTLQMEATVLPANATDNSVTWSVTNGTGSATIDANGVLTATGNGTVTVTATANDGSGVSGSTVITISNQIGLDEFNLQNNLKVYPNPTKDCINILSSMQISLIQITDLSGRVIKNINVNSTSFSSIDISELSTGIYVINVYDNNNRIYRIKIVKE